MIPTIGHVAVLVGLALSAYAIVDLNGLEDVDLLPGAVLQLP